MQVLATKWKPLGQPFTVLASLAILYPDHPGLISTCSISWQNYEITASGAVRVLATIWKPLGQPFTILASLVIPQAGHPGHNQHLLHMLAEL